MNNQNWAQDSQAHTRIAILESQIEDREITIERLKIEIERLTNLVGTLIKEDKWEGCDIEPTLEYKLDEKETK